MTSEQKNVALVLSSGGPRGFAYIGAIEELEARGYTITSVAGTSIGSLVGGIYAAGQLPVFKEWIFSLDAWDVFHLMDLSLSKNHFVKGEKVINAMKEFVPDVNIEDLAIPFCAVATDLYTGEEVLFDKGKLFTAIRASISIPSMFRPVKHGITTLIDGGIANCLPLDRVKRTPGDLMVAFDVNDVDVQGLRDILTRLNEQAMAREAFERETMEELHGLIRQVKEHSGISLVKRLKYAGSKSINLLKEVIDRHRSDNDEIELEYGDTYYALLERTFNLMNHTNTKLSLQLHRPDILVRMPFDAYGDISDYAKAEEIAAAGRQLMQDALDRFETQNP